MAASFIPPKYPMMARPSLGLGEITAVPSPTLYSDLPSLAALLSGRLPLLVNAPTHIRCGMIRLETKIFEEKNHGKTSHAHGC
mgnify:CR=1 FL=1